MMIGLAVALVIVASIGDGSSSSAAAGTGHASVNSGTGGTNGSPDIGGTNGSGTTVVTKASEIEGVGFPAVAALLAGGVALLTARAGALKTGRRVAREPDGNGP
jgi:hypothetical protein